MPKVDGVFRMRSQGTASSGMQDQYADGKAAKLWQLYIGDQKDRTEKYRNFLISLLKRKGVKTVLDAACGTGVDSVMLVEEGFKVVSSDASDKMLKDCYKTRWMRRKEHMFDEWVIEEANWLTLDQQVPVPAGGYDALIVMGNSFAHLPDDHGDQRDQRKCIENFSKLVKPGGIFVIDHRNYDYILENGHAPKKNIYYNSSHIKDIKTSILYINQQPNLITLDYFMAVEDEEYGTDDTHFRLSYYPHTVREFSSLLRSAFGHKSKHTVYADFKSMAEEPEPSFYIHVIEKSL
eukprot:TRINITY_DN4113_c0_g1_i1.p1 TRINITY_DN4113_c0_g1~~TRINITY_DN4113_c0_g1_i1.p1  ORF type:complete len:292 (+),score=94.10 TRINITY_DN4113_c0_g1_i1:68-943(+)